MKAQPGHLAVGPLLLKQTERTKKKLSDREHYRRVMEKFRTPVLDWKCKGK